MKLNRKKALQILLSRHATKPLKSLGQNFLLDESVLHEICSAARLRKKDTVIEIGPGAGILTLCLAKKAKRVIAIEKDPKMIAALKETTKKNKNIKMLNEDALYSKIRTKNRKLIANLPYYVATQIIKKFLTKNLPPSVMVVMVQKEVAERMMAKPPKMNMLSSFVQSLSRVEKIKIVKKGSFWPPPKVDSTVIRISPFKKRETKNFYKTLFFLLKTGFSHPRKQLSANFSRTGELKEQIFLAAKKSEIDTKRRAESLSVEEWSKITKALLYLQGNK